MGRQLLLGVLFSLSKISITSLTTSCGSPASRFFINFMPYILIAFAKNFGSAENRLTRILPEFGDAPHVRRRAAEVRIVVTLLCAVALMIQFLKIIDKYKVYIFSHASNRRDFLCFIKRRSRVLCQVEFFRGVVERGTFVGHFRL